MSKRTSNADDAARYRKLRDHCDLSSGAYFVTSANGNRIDGDVMDGLIDRWVSPPMISRNCRHEWYWPQANDGEWCRHCGKPKPLEAA